MQKKYLMTPGPTPVPQEVLLKMAEPIIHHRTAEFEGALRTAIENLKVLYNTNESDILIYAASGTGVMEAAIVNSFSAGDPVIVCRNGKFADRQKEICDAFGIDVIDLNYDWDTLVNPADIKRILEEKAAEGITVRGVIVTHSETSTGALNPIEEIGAIVKNYPDTIFIVDSITGIGASDVQTDKWGLDIVTTGSQKGLMLPPGLAVVSVSPKAWKAYERATLPKFYFDFASHKKQLEKNTTPFTPAVSLIMGLNEAVGMIIEEGLENTLARHSRLARATHAGVEAIGLKLYAPAEGRSAAVTTVLVPESVDCKKLIGLMKNKHGVTVAGGQDHLSGRIIRIGHLGYFGNFDTIVTLSALEMALAELGYEFEQGASIRAAQAVFAES